MEMKSPKPSLSLDVSTLWSLLLIAMALLLAQSRFFLTPGMVIELPTNYPSLSESTLTAECVTVRGVNRFVFRNEIVSQNDLFLQFSQHAEDFRETGRALLVHCDRRASMEAFLQVADAAKRAGIPSIQIALLNADNPSASGNAIYYPSKFSVQPEIPPNHHEIQTREASNPSFYDRSLQPIEKSYLEAVLMDKHFLRSLLPRLQTGEGGSDAAHP